MELKKRQLRYNVKTAELREEGSTVTFVGTAVVYDSPSELIFGMFREYIKPGAFDKCLAKKPDVMCFRDHNPERILGRTSAGTLKLLQRDHGIDVECSMPNTTYGIDLRESVKRGDIKGMSFGFDVLDDDWRLVSGERTRDVVSADLFEVSFLPNPAYPDSTASVRDRETLEAFFAKSDTELRKRRLRYLQHGI